MKKGGMCPVSPRQDRAGLMGVHYRKVHSAQYDHRDGATTAQAASESREGLPSHATCKVENYMPKVIQKAFLYWEDGFRLDF